MSTGTNIMGEPLRGQIMDKITARSLDDLRQVRDAASAACDAWSDGEDEDTMRRAEARLDRAYDRWQRGDR